MYKPLLHITINTISTYYLDGNLLNSAKYIFLNKVHSSDSEVNMKTCCALKKMFITNFKNKWKSFPSKSKQPQYATEVRCVVQLKI